MPLNNIEQEVMKEFDGIFLPMVFYKGKSLKPIHPEIADELKSFLSTALSKAYEEGKMEMVEELIKEIEGMRKPEPSLENYPWIGDINHNARLNEIIKLLKNKEI